MSKIDLCDGMSSQIDGHRQWQPWSPLSAAASARSQPGSTVFKERSPSHLSELFLSRPLLLKALLKAVVIVVAWVPAIPFSSFCLCLSPYSISSPTPWFTRHPSPCLACLSWFSFARQPAKETKDHHIRQKARAPPWPSPDRASPPSASTVSDSSHQAASVEGNQPPLFHSAVAWIDRLSSALLPPSVPLCPAASASAAPTVPPALALRLVSLTLDTAPQRASHPPSPSPQGSPTARFHATKLSKKPNHPSTDRADARSRRPVAAATHAPPTSWLEPRTANNERAARPLSTTAFHALHLPLVQFAYPSSFARQPHRP
ncbi:hypothetical protein VDGL01_04833 [Verticillium dahliae]